MRACRPAATAAFTLIEMSVVLVIIGLLTGGILIGSTLLRQSQLTSVAVDVQRYANAAQMFQKKYSALPGDMATATSFWGASGGSASDNYTTTCYTAAAGSQKSPATCNGNGDGQVGAPGANQENFLFWQHLADAGLIQGQYTGMAGSAGSTDHVIGINCPATRMEGAGFGLQFVGIMSGNATWYNGNYGHVLIMGRYWSNTWPVNYALTTSEAAVVDSKYDDGLPGLGNIRSFNTVITNCSTTNNPSTAAYAITTVSGVQCALTFITGF